jgi:hypothetical protein
MSCQGCKKIKIDEQRVQIRKMAAFIALQDKKTQIIIEIDGKLYVECESCWEKAGRVGTPVEYFIY